MNRQRETNPHFLDLQPQNEPQPPESAATNPHFLPLQPTQHQPQTPRSQLNPHFLPSQPPQHQPQLPQSHFNPSLELPTQTQTQTRPQPGPSLELATQPITRQQPRPSLELATQPKIRPQNKSKRSRAQHGAGLLADPTRSHHGPDLRSPAHSQPHPQRQPHGTELLVAASAARPHQLPRHSDQPSGRQQPQSSVQRIPPPRKTKPFTWCIAILCAIFWIIIILVGLIVLIIYLAYHPKSPKFDVAGASLNAVYLDMGYLLNADLTFLANFTNPNKKVTVNFKHIVINLYFEGVPIATRYIDHFHIRKSQYLLTNVHMVTSQVRLSSLHSQVLKKQIESGRVKFEIKGLFRTRSYLGNVLKYTYWLYGHCDIVMSGPPGGVLVAKTCETKR